MIDYSVKFNESSIKPESDNCKNSNLKTKQDVQSNLTSSESNLKSDKKTKLKENPNLSTISNSQLINDLNSTHYNNINKQEIENYLAIYNQNKFKNSTDAVNFTDSNGQSSIQLQSTTFSSLSDNILFKTGKFESILKLVPKILYFIWLSFF